MEDALYQQLEQERLLNQVTAQVRQSLDLPVILSTAVEQLRGLLQVNRVLIYQFHSYQLIPPWESTENDPLSPDPLETDHSQPLESITQGFGQVTYEVCSDQRIQPILHLSRMDECFESRIDFQEKYRHGGMCAVADVEQTYRNNPCFLVFLRRFQIRAKLVVAIVVKQQLWGLLIAHQCFEPYQWSEQKIKFVVQITEHLSIAIYQAQLFAQVQQQKQTLEQRVQERTQALQETMLAAQAASRAKSEFLAAMSHELRTPLTCIIGISATLLRLKSNLLANPERLQEKQQNYLETIHDSGTHLLALINDILDLSQVEAGKTILKISQFSLSKLAQQSLGLFYEKSSQKGVTLKDEFQIYPGQDLFTADERRVKQILYNLLSNGIKFTPSKGEVTLRIWIENTTAIFQIEDTGIGIPQEQHSLLFEKFQQLDASYNRQYGGTGLGLALTKQLVELHGGVIQFKSTVNVGSIFTVYLPAQPLALINSNEKTDIIPAHSHLSTPNDLDSNHCFVVIEQDESTATLICELLTASGYQVVWLGEGFTAIKQIELLKPSAVILDLDLPHHEGHEILHLLKKNSATEHLKIIALTRKNDREQELERGNINVDAWIEKPIQYNDLINQIFKLGIENEPTV